jgi:hypothetical protein
LKSWTLSDDDSDSIVIATDLIVQPKQYVVLANNGKASLNGGLPKVDYVYSSQQMVLNRRDQVVLRNRNGERVVDRVNWAIRGDFPRRQGASIAVRSVNLDNAVGSHWCLASTVYNFEFG